MKNKRTGPIWVNALPRHGFDTVSKVRSQSSLSGEKSYEDQETLNLSENQTRCALDLGAASLFNVFHLNQNIPPARK
jgi:hypothetical protein